MRLLNKIYAEIYMAIFSHYLGKAIIGLNEIEHRILDHGMYFLVYSVQGPAVKEFYKVAKNPMGRKVGWLQNLAKGEVDESKIPPEKVHLKRLTDAHAFVSTDAMIEIVAILDSLIQDTRNPLVHSKYYFTFDGRTSPVTQIHNLNFKRLAIRDIRNYTKEIEKTKEKLTQLFYFQAIKVLTPTR